MGIHAKGSGSFLICGSANNGGDRHEGESTKVSVECGAANPWYKNFIVMAHGYRIGRSEWQVRLRRIQCRVCTVRPPVTRRAIELFDDLTGMIKIEQESRTHAAVRAIGAGFQSVLFADIRSVGDAKQCVNAVRSERPQSQGLHGVNLQRANLLEAGTQAWADALDQVVIVLMIEKKEAFLQLDEILSVNGVDMVQFGPADI